MMRTMVEEESVGGDYHGTKGAHEHDGFGGEVKGALYVPVG